MGSLQKITYAVRMACVRPVHTCKKVSTEIPKAKKFNSLKDNFKIDYKKLYDFFIIREYPDTISLIRKSSQHTSINKITIKRERASFTTMNGDVKMDYSEDEKKHVYGVEGADVFSMLDALCDFLPIKEGK